MATATAYQSNNTRFNSRLLVVFFDKESLYGYTSDPSLWIYIALAIFCLIDKKASGNEQNLYYYGLMIGFGVIFIAWISIERQLRNIDPPISRFTGWKFKLIVTALNILLVGVPITIFLVTGKLDFTSIKHTCIVAVYEQLIFGIAVPYLFVRGFQLALKGRNWYIRVFIPAVMVSSIGFAFLHVYVYNYEMNTIIYIMLIGFLLHLICYLVPSPSMSIHFLINSTVMAMQFVPLIH